MGFEGPSKSERDRLYDALSKLESNFKPAAEPLFTTEIDGSKVELRSAEDADRYKVSVDSSEFDVRILNGQVQSIQNMTALTDMDSDDSILKAKVTEAINQYHKSHLQ
ncbi:hypothetical protein CL653_00660 [bacterium]|nr:hypothetical protein [bacterium]|tara:strand:+ start:222 stop:545 length:324 start_codon:yes stop_codon:yes gene_type:complete